MVPGGNSQCSILVLFLTEKKKHAERRILVDIGFSLDTHTSMKEREM